ncbi:hypothetical protein LY76DRAFT_591312 [Colletotrichum caudatum]|nr:hypothetical protein LY76DRAFT_591312 [Colletotrichum caudatum]
MSLFPLLISSLSLRRVVPSFLFPPLSRLAEREGERAKERERRESSVPSFPPLPLPLLLFPPIITHPKRGMNKAWVGCSAQSIRATPPTCQFHTDTIT